MINRDRNLILVVTGAIAAAICVASQSYATLVVTLLVLGGMYHTNDI